LVERNSEPDAGLYACSPKGAGFEATFEIFEVIAI
jgi:hypothetical protein